ncbi:FG-GAP repeat domain-containing protein [Algoriphagus namhaensis]|uniref:FG-GAP repeat domain-containing protein n=1 Tax=Algoriphagus namhaensis TaxID=915353 RepID=A0ABV8AMD4_9BACT
MRNLRVILAILLVTMACEPISERKQPPPSLEQLAADQNLNLSGGQLAKAYCGSCHIAPDPSVLDRPTWESSVLPDMRMRLGLIIPEDFGRTMPVDMNVPEGVYSPVPLITRPNWDKIAEYYLENAPSEPLPQKVKAKPTFGLPIFNVIQPSFPKSNPDLTTLLAFDEKRGDVYLGHRFKTLFILDPSDGFQVKDSVFIGSSVVQICFDEESNGFELLTMGGMDPSNDSLGILTRYDLHDSSNWESKIIINNLMRPVHTTRGDWNSDGVEDRVICHFGNHIGKLSMYLSEGNSFREVVLKNLPGARKSIPVDFDLDGDLDLLVAMTQANEGIVFWENDGTGNFKERQLLGFQPSFGLSDFSFEDMNGDGLPDIITVNGDNADQSQILKNYHGVRIFLNRGEEEFEETWFYPIYGATGLEVADFDLDGDMDLFTLAFFPDPNQSPSQSLIYFSQSSSLQFDPFVPKLSTKNKWLTLTKGDLGGDGDLDIVVGEFDFDELYQAPKDNWQPILIFENEIK